MVLKKMDRFAASLGVKIILEEGTPFDPVVHEAVANRNPGSTSLEVLELVQPGYLLDGKVLRPARVIVGASDESVHTMEEIAPSSPF
jgi:molecular chaperone GrpE